MKIYQSCITYMLCLFVLDVIFAFKILVFSV